jgi:hypothetical protein
MIFTVLNMNKRPDELNLFFPVEGCAPMQTLGASSCVNIIKDEEASGRRWGSAAFDREM